MKKLTTIEWLIDQLRNTREFQAMINSINANSSITKNVLEEAFEMEKKQIQDAYIDGKIDGYNYNYKDYYYYNYQK